MRRSFKRVVFVLVGMGIVLGVTLACGSTESETPDSTDAAAAEDTATNQDTSSVDSAAPEPAAAKDTTTAQNPSADTGPPGKVESLLSGETLARYRALPEEYRVALESYARFGVSEDLIPTVVAEKMAQWPDSPEPIRDLLDAERYAKFEEFTAIHPNPSIGDKARVHRHAFFFLGYYPYVLKNEDTADGRKQAFADLLDAFADRFEHGKEPNVPAPLLDGLIVPSAMAALDTLGPRLRDAIAIPEPTTTFSLNAMAVEIVGKEVLLLKSEPGLEIPTMDEFLSTEEQGLFKGLPADIRESADGRFAHGVVWIMTGMATSGDHPVTTLPSLEDLTKVAQHRFEIVQHLAK